MKRIISKNFYICKMNTAMLSDKDLIVLTCYKCYNQHDIAKRMIRMSRLYEKIYHYILDEIKSGRLQSGEKIPTESELSDQFNVSRITSKKALDLLSQQHIIERFQGKGSFVSGILPQLPDVQLNGTDYEEEEEHNETLVGLIIPEFSDTYGLDLVKAIEQKCAEYHYSMVLKRSYGDEEKEKQAIETLLKIGVKGILIIPVHGVHYNNELLRLVLDQYPIVLVDRYLKGISASSVSIDNKQAAKEITKYFLREGHEHIAFISPSPEGTSSLEERLYGFQVAFSEMGKPLNPDYILMNIESTKHKGIFSNKTREYKQRDYENIKHFIDNNPSLSAIICSEFEIAVLVNQVLERAGKKTPEDISIICFDSPQGYIHPPLFTHIQQDQWLMGYKAVELLHDQLIGNEPTENYYIDYKFIKGCSTK